MLKFTKDNKLEDLPEKINWLVTLSNWKVIEVKHRATLYAYLERWYYLDENDKIEFAIIN